jgi:hypothetical protein
MSAARDITEPLRWHGGRIVGGLFTAKQLRERQAARCAALRAQHVVVLTEMKRLRERGEERSPRYAALRTEEDDCRANYTRAWAELNALYRATSGRE